MKKAITVQTGVNAPLEKVWEYWKSGFAKKGESSVHQMARDRLEELKAPD